MPGRRGRVRTSPEGWLLCEGPLEGETGGVLAGGPHNAACEPRRAIEDGEVSQRHAA